MSCRTVPLCDIRVLAVKNQIGEICGLAAVVSVLSSAMPCPAAVLLLAVAVPPEMRVPPAAGAAKENETREQQRDDERKLGAVLCCDVAGLGVEIE